MSNQRLAPCATCGRMTRALVIWPNLPDEFTPCCRRAECRAGLREAADKMPTRHTGEDQR